jgi:plasmid stabilization system protein ParE
MSRVLKRPRALIDVEEQARWIADENPDAARCFRRGFRCVDRTYGGEQRTG